MLISLRAERVKYLKTSKFTTTVPNSRSECTYLTLFQTKMVKIYTLFQTKTAQKPKPKFQFLSSFVSAGAFCVRMKVLSNDFWHRKSPRVDPNKAKSPCQLIGANKHLFPQRSNAARARNMTRITQHSRPQGLCSMLYFTTFKEEDSSGDENER